MENLPIALHVGFACITFLTVLLFARAARNRTEVLVLLTGWLLLQAIISRSGFYTDTNAMPPRFFLLVFPPLAVILVTFFTRNGRRFIDELDAKQLVLVHVVRLPVELVLFVLYSYAVIPGLMTFEGRNFDIFSGISAPLIWYFGYFRKKLSAPVLIGWHLACLALLINIVMHAVLAAPFPFQRLAFDQPNIAVLHFPYVWLPGCIVPLVLFSHLVSLRRLMNEVKTARTARTALNPMVNRGIGNV